MADFASQWFVFEAIRYTLQKLLDSFDQRLPRDYFAKADDARELFRQALLDAIHQAESQQEYFGQQGRRDDG